jgi:hypothetical protein
VKQIYWLVVISLVLAIVAVLLFMLMTLGELSTVRHSIWYKTTDLDAPKDTANHVQDYNNTKVSGRVFEFQGNLIPVSRAIQINLGSPAELLLTDSQGRKLGKNPATGIEYNEIPNGVYYEQAAVYSESLENSNKPPHVTKILFVDDVSDDVYTLEVLGTGSGEYYLSVYTNDSNSNGHTDYVIGQTSVGQRDFYIVDVEVGDGALSNIIAALYEAADQLSETDREKILKMLSVIEDKVEKSNSIAAESVTASLLTYIAHKNITDSAVLVALLEDLLTSLE